MRWSIRWHENLNPNETDATNRDRLGGRSERAPDLQDACCDKQFVIGDLVARIRGLESASNNEIHITFVVRTRRNEHRMRKRDRQFVAGHPLREVLGAGITNEYLCVERTHAEIRDDSCQISRPPSP